MSNPPTSSNHLCAGRCTHGAGSNRACALRVLKPRADNFVERPWGGLWLRSYKRLMPLPDQKRISGLGLGEAFEISAFDDDTEAREHPSLLPLPDGSVVTLPALLARDGCDLLGPAFTVRHGYKIPLLPKTLDIAELLSVQAHPPGQTEVYVILAAEPGATLRLGFRHTLAQAELRNRLMSGLQAQRALLATLRPDADLNALQGALASHFADRGEPVQAAWQALTAMLMPDAEQTTVLATWAALKNCYWWMLDQLNEIPVRPGQIFYNATPDRLMAASGRPRTAEVHALGNPEGREILALEIRLPGVTYRAWDHGRLPPRRIDLDAALATLSLQATAPCEFERIAQSVTGHPGVYLSVQDPGYTVHHLRPRPNQPVRPLCHGRWHTLHAVAGRADICTTDGDCRQVLQSGESALVSVGSDGYCLITNEVDTDIVQVTVPQPSDPDEG